MHCTSIYCKGLCAKILYFLCITYILHIVYQHFYGYMAFQQTAEIKLDVFFCKTIKKNSAKNSAILKVNAINTSKTGIYTFKIVNYTSISCRIDNKGEVSFLLMPYTYEAYKIKEGGYSVLEKVLME